MTSRVERVIGRRSLFGVLVLAVSLGIFLAFLYNDRSEVIAQNCESLQKVIATINVHDRALYGQRFRPIPHPSC